MARQSGRTILIVEDVEEISSGMESALLEHGHEVRFASSAEEAIQMAEDDLPSAILTDLELPTLDLLLEFVRQHKDLNNVIVAVIDINGPEVRDPRLTILTDFDALDRLISTTPK